MSNIWSEPLQIYCHALCVQIVRLVSVFSDCLCINHYPANTLSPETAVCFSCLLLPVALYSNALQITFHHGFVCFNTLHQCQQFFSPVRTIPCLPGLNQHQAVDIVSCSRKDTTQ